MAFKPLFQNPETATARKSYYDLIDVDAFTPVDTHILTHQREGTTGSSATRWAITLDGDLVVQQASIMFGEAPTYREGLVDIDDGFKVAGELADFVAHNYFEAQGALFEPVDGMNANVARIEIPGKGYYNVWYEPQKWLSVKRMNEREMQRYIDLDGNPIGHPNVGVKATSLFEQAVAR